MPRSRSRRVALLVLVLLAAAALAALALRPHAEPSVRVTGVENAWGPVTEDETTVRTTLTLENASPFPVTVTNVTYRLVANGVPLGAGALDASTVLPADASRAVTLTTRLDTARFVSEWWPAHVAAGERTTLEVRGAVDARVGPVTREVPFVESRAWETDILGSLEAELRSCPSSGFEPCIVSSTHAWERSTPESTRLASELRVHNPTLLPIPLGHVAFDLALAGVDVADGDTDSAILLRPGGTTRVGVTSTLDHDALRAWWPRHVDACEESPARVTVRLARGLLAVDAPLPPVETRFACP